MQEFEVNLMPLSLLFLFQYRRDGSETFANYWKVSQYSVRDRSGGNGAHLLS